MQRIYLATLIGAVISTSLASRMFAVATFGPARTNPFTRLGSVSRAVLARLRRSLDDRIAMILADCERRASIQRLHRMTDRELSDIGISRCSIAQIGRGLVREDQPFPADRASAWPEIRARLS